MMKNDKIKYIHKSLIFAAFLSISIFGVKAQTPPKDVRNAPEMIRLDDKNIKFEPYAFINQMPTVFIPGEEKTPDYCSKSGRFYVVATLLNVDESVLPSGIKIKDVWINQKNIWWKGTFNEDETTISDNKIRTVARDCAENLFRKNMSKKIKVIISLTFQGRTYYLRSSQKGFFSAV